MKQCFAICFLLLGCRQNQTAGRAGEVTPSAPTPSKQTSAASRELTVPVVGEAYRLRLNAASLTFCDDRGGRQVSLADGKEDRAEQVCGKGKDEGSQPADEKMVEVSSPNMNGEANDRLCVDDCYTLRGRAHTWANDGKLVIVGTGSAVELIDGTSGKVAVIDREGTERVTIGSGWVAWVSSGAKSIQLAAIPVALSKGA